MKGNDVEMKNEKLTSLSKLIEKYESNEATLNERLMMEKMINWISGVETNGYLISLQHLLEKEGNKAIMFEKCDHFNSLFYDVEEGKVLLKSSGDHFKSRKEMKEALYQANIMF